MRGFLQKNFKRVPDPFGQTDLWLVMSCPSRQMPATSTRARPPACLGRGQPLHVVKAVEQPATNPTLKYALTQVPAPWRHGVLWPRTEERVAYMHAHSQQKPPRGIEPLTIRLRSACSTN